jgi:phosphoglycerate kinase
MQDVFVDKARRKNISSVKLAKKMLKRNSDKFILPIDMVAGSKMDKESLVEIIDLEKKDVINKRWMFLDIGPKTIATFLPLIKNAKTIFWNGPMGVFEIEKFSFATKKISQAVGRSKALSIIGGGDTEVVVSKYKIEDKISHVSTGGGASLEFLSGKEFPVTKYLIKKSDIRLRK